MSEKILRWSFYLLFFLTPLIFTPLNNELFEYNKMMFVYLLTSIITITWLIKMIQEKTLLIKRTPLDIPLMLFLASQILSTIFSIDTHTSIWGYYSRSNGGLLSIISYILLYYAFVSNFDKEQVIRFIKATLFGGLLVALYAIPEHFGVSPSCVILTQQLRADCWVQDVQSRVFATLGQPNWLAAYLGMLIFPALYFIITAKSRFETIRYTLYAICYYLAFTFTYSRGATLGFLGGLGVFILGFLLCHPDPALDGRRISNLVSVISFSRIREGFLSFDKLRIGMTKSLLLVLGFMLLINLLFGSALTGDFRLIKQAAPPPRPGIAAGLAQGGTQLETGGSESGQIRLIVWKGALEIFKHNSLIGTGVETFAYSYYNFRPEAHNLVSEWDFLYNKAHNEYLNYLATTGVLGFGSYMIMILTFIYWCVRWVMGNVKGEKHITHNSLLITSLLASYISYLIQNFFGFSVVMIALLFYLFPALGFVAAGSLKPLKVGHRIRRLGDLLYQKPFYPKLATFLLIFAAFSMALNLRNLWLADVNYKLGSDYLDSGNPGRGYNYLLDAMRLNKSEPLYKSDLGYAAASASVALLEEDATTSGRLKEEAVELTQDVLEKSPKNTSFFRTAIRTFYQLSAIDSKFEKKTLEVVDKTIALAPTDAKLYYNKGLILYQLNRPEEAVVSFNQALELRPNYREAYLTLGTVYEQKKEVNRAIEQYEQVLKFIPNDPDALKKLEELKKN